MYPNFWRGIVLTQGALVFLMTAAVVIRYSLTFRKLEKRDRVLPIHIVTIATSYLLAIIFVVFGILEHWDSNQLTFRTPLGGAIFILGDIGLVFMLIHIAIQRKYIGVVRNHVAAESNKEKEEVAAELKRQTEGIKEELKKEIHDVGEKADAAYHEANTVNLKIAKLHEEFSEVQHQSGEIITAIDETGKDTNKRIRRIEPKISTK